ncbi:hypothetical protein [uncultured Paracoccus sp.]|uniref:hypothetical protein n=1 Tax=uncultured Paracoccus sp. TaxID=189685 RepID=UPI0025E01FD3|nr:hypothetical protein [uncultured Paracoccus sp.]
MKQVLQIPADVGGYCREAAYALTAHARLIERALDLWSDTDPDPDPENGHFWTIQIDHPDAHTMQRNLTKAAALLEMLHDHGLRDAEADHVGA